MKLAALAGSVEEVKGAAGDVQSSATNGSGLPGMFKKVLSARTWNMLASENTSSEEKREMEDERTAKVCSRRSKISSMRFVYRACDAVRRRRRRRRKMPEADAIAY